MDRPKPAHFLASTSQAFRYVEKTNPRSSNLQFLTYGVYELSGPVHSGLLSHTNEEALLFCWKGSVTATVDGRDHPLERYDVLYVPRNAAYALKQQDGQSQVIVCRANAENCHPVFHAKWKEF